MQDFSSLEMPPKSASPQHNPQAASVFGLHDFSFQPSIEQLPFIYRTNGIEKRQNKWSKGLQKLSEILRPLEHDFS